ncbi:hypothetical protein V6R21_20740 [Limibacter armeniacum]|uniref:tetratricopeptide repeat protein n=1 Tax=Limibacter armeniacum TaxID=466084 RepID=UPI002FE5E09C
MHLYLENLAEITPILLNSDKDTYEESLSKLNERLNKLDKLPSSPYKTFATAEIHLQWAFVKARYGESINAFLDFRKAYRYTAYNLEQHPDFTPSKKTMGILALTLKAIPENLHWITKLLGISPSEESLLYLYGIADSSDLLSEEAQLATALIQAYLLNEGEAALSSIKKQIAARPDNLITHLAGAWIALKHSDSQFGLKCVQKLESKNTWFDYLPYLKGNLLLCNGKFKPAAIQLQHFLDINQGKDYIKDSNFKLFLCYWFTGHPDNKYLKAAQSEGSTLAAADRYALRFSEYKKLPNKDITLARILTDGGEYTQALSVLEKIPLDSLTSDEDRVEYLYRKARIYHKIHKAQQALYFYQKTVESGARIPRYFAANSCLQMGILMQQSGNNSKAVKYYHQVLEFDEHEYKSSLDYQAKIRIRQLAK